MKKKVGNSNRERETRLKFALTFLVGLLGLLPPAEEHAADADDEEGHDDGRDDGNDDDDVHGVSHLDQADS